MTREQVYKMIDDYMSAIEGKGISADTVKASVDAFLALVTE